jgi:glycosyltransferase involved in cell wall biosynthesis
MSIEALLVAPSFVGGEGVYSRTLIEHPPTGTRYSVTASPHGSAPGARCQLVAEVLLNRLVRPVTFPDAGFRALHLQNRFDLVHVHAHPVVLRGIGSTPVVMSEGSSSAVYLRDYLGWEHGRIAAGYGRARRIYRTLHVKDRLLAQDRVARVFVFSRWARSVNIDWGADPEKTEVVHPGFPTPPNRERRDREEFRFLFVGTDFERKGGFEVLEAFDEVVQHLPATRLTVISPDPAVPNPDRRFHGWVDSARRSAGLARLARLVRAGLVDLRSPVEREQLYAAHYPAADAFVMPTHAEGLGFTNIEAMGFGLPVISSRVGPIPEVVADGATGRLVPSGDVHALTDAMLRLAGDPESARQLGAAARLAFLERFTLDRFTAALADLYQRVLSA